MNVLSNISRSEGDPRIIRSGPSSLGAADRLARGLGWFSIGLGVAELLAAERITRALGMEGKEALVRAYGIREISSGVLSLSIDKQLGLWSRVAGDGVDIATLATGLHPDNRKRDNVGVALAMVAGVMLLDLVAAKSVSATHGRSPGEPRDYSQRSGFPGGLGAARGVAKRDFETPADMRAALSPA